MNIWQKRKKPIFILAPMEDVTDTVFRRIVKSCAAPDLFFTEFTNADGLASEGRAIVGQRLKFTDEEHPIIAQLWGKDPEHFYEAAKYIVELGFDGIDLNFGCPEKSVVKNGCCAAMIGNEQAVVDIVRAVKRGARGSIPISLKTRLGNKTIVTDTWIPFLLSLDLDALTIHGRTAAEMSAVPAHWDEIGKVVAIRNDLKSKTIIIGNGDVRDRADGLDKIETYGVDGVMIGRGIFENLWVFDTHQRTHTLHEHLAIMREHVELYDKTWDTIPRFPELKPPNSGNLKNYATLRKFFKIYVKGFEGASEWREKVMSTRTPAEVYPIIDELISLGR